MALLSGARLCVLRKKGEGFICEVPVRTNLVTIGFELHCTIRLKSELAEQLHCKIFVRNKKVTIANYSTKNPISVDGKVITKRGILHDGSTIEVCGTRFRWQFDESLLSNRLEKSKKIQSTPTSSKLGSRRRTMLVPKKVQATEEPAAVAGPSRKSGPKKTQKQPTYTLPKSNKQLMKKIKKRFTMHSVMIDHDLEDDDDEEADKEESEPNETNASLSKVVEPSCETPKKLVPADVSKNNTPFYTPDPEKENQTPVMVGKTPGTSKPLALENSAMMILSYTPVIAPRVKTNLQKTPLSKKKATTPLVRSGYLTPKIENLPMNNTPVKGVQNVAKGGNSMYLIDLTSPTSANDSSFVYSQSDGSFSSSAGLIDLTTPPSKKLKTPSSTVARSAQKGLLRSALKNASKTPLSALRSRLAKDTPKNISKIRLDDSVDKTSVTPAKGRIGSRPTTPASATKSKLRSQAGTPAVDSPAVSVESSKPETPITNSKDELPKSVMTTDKLFDTLVGRPSVTKTYTRKSESPKKLPSPLVAVQDSNDLPKTDVDLWVESVVAAVTSPEPLESFIKKPNRTTQVRSSQYSDITPHDSFTDVQNVATVDPQEVSTPIDNDELNNMADKPSIPHVARKSHTPLTSKIVRSFGNKRQTIGNFFTNMFGKLTVSPVTRVSITNETQSEDALEDLDRNSEHESDGSEEVYHDSESDHPHEPDKPLEPVINPSPKLRQSLRDTRKFIGNALTSLNTSRLTMDDNTADIDESLLLSDTYEDNTNQTEAVEDIYDLTDLSAVRDASANDQSKLITPAKSARKTLSRDFRAEISPMVGSNGRFVRQVQTPLSVSTPAGKRRSTRQQQQIAVDISPLAVPIQGTPIKSPQSKADSPEMTAEQETSMSENGEPQGTSFIVDKSESVHQLDSATETDQASPMDVTREDCTADTLNQSGVEPSTIENNVMSSAKSTVDSNSRSTRMSIRVSRCSYGNVSQHEELTSIGEDFAHAEQTPDVTSVDHSSKNRSNLNASIIEQAHQDDDTELNPDDPESSPPPSERRASSRHSVASPSAVQRRRTTTNSSTPQPEFKSMRGGRQSIAVMGATPPSVDKDRVDNKIPLSESKLPLRVHRLTKRSPLVETKEPLNASTDGNAPIAETLTEDVTEKVGVDAEQDVTNVDTSIVSIKDSSSNQDSSCMPTITENLDASTLEQVPVSEVPPESPVRQARSTPRTPRTPVTVSSSNERLSMTVEKPMRKPANGTPLLRKAIFAMCTPTRSSRSSVTKEAHQESTSTRVSRSSRRSVVDELASFNETTPLKVEEESADTISADHSRVELEVTSVKTAPRTRGTITNVGTPVPTPVSRTTETPASVRRSLMTPRADIPVTQLTESATPVNDNPTSKLSTPNQTAERVSRRLTIAKKSTPTQAETDVCNELSANEVLDKLEQQLSVKSVEHQEPIITAESPESETTTTPVGQTPRSRRRGSAVQTSQFAMNHTDDSIVEKSMVGQDFSSLPAEEPPIKHSPKQSNQNASLGCAEVSDDIHASYGILHESSSNDGTLQVSTVDATPIKHTPRTRGRASKPDTPISTPASIISKQVIRTPSSVTKSLLTTQQLDHIPEKAAEQDNRLDTTTEADTPAKAADASPLELTPSSMRSGTSIGLDVVFKTPRPVRDTRMSLATLKKTPGTPVSQGNSISSRTVSQNTTGRRSAKRSSTVTVDSPCVAKVDISEDPESTERFSSTADDNNSPKKVAMSPCVVEETPRNTTSSLDDETTTSVVLCPDLLKHLCERVITLEHAMENLEDPSQQSLEITAVNSTDNLEGIKHLLETPAATSTVRKKLRSSAAVVGLNETDDLEGLGQLLKSPPAEKSSSLETSAVAPESRKALRLSAVSTEHDRSSSLNASSKLYLAEINIGSSVNATANTTTYLTGVQKLLKTPSPASVRRSVTNSSINLEGIQQLLDTPNVNAASVSIRNRSTRSSTALDNTMHLEGVRQLLKTPVASIAKMIPSASKASATKETNHDATFDMEGVEQMLATPNARVVSVSENNRTTRSSSASLDSTMQLEGVQQLLKTPVVTRVLPDDSYNMDGVQQKTPVAAVSKKFAVMDDSGSNSTLDVEGEQQILTITSVSVSSNTRNSTALLDSTMHLEGVQQLLKTPATSISKKRTSASMSNVMNETDIDTTFDMAGVQQILTTPKANEVSGSNRTATIKNLNIAMNSTLHLEGVQKLMHTPVATCTLPNDSYSLDGIQQMLETPVASGSKQPAVMNDTGRNSTLDFEGVQQLLTTPKATVPSVPQKTRNIRYSTAPLDSTINLEGVQKLMQTPVAARTLPNDSYNLDGVEQFLKTPATTTQISMRVSTTSKMLDSTVNFSVANEVVDTLTASVSNELFETSETELNCITPAQIEDTATANANEIVLSVKQLDTSTSSMNRSAERSPTAFDSFDLDGVHQLLKTPVTVRKSSRSSLVNTSNLPSVQQLMATPVSSSPTSSKNSPAVLKTPAANLDGVQQLFKTPGAPLTGRKTLRSSVVELQETSIASSNDSTKFEGVHQLLRTPVTTTSSRRMTVSSELDSTLHLGSTSEKLSNTPSVRTDLNATTHNETVDMDGIQQSFTQPVLESSVNLEGLGQLLDTPVVKSAPNDSCNLEGIQRLLTTPAASRRSSRRSALDNELNLTGVQQLMATPQTTSTVKRSTTALNTTSGDANLDGIQEMFKTPLAVSGLRKNTRSNVTKLNLDESINYDGIEQLMGSPVASTPLKIIIRKQMKESIPDSTINLQGIEQLLSTPVANVSISEKCAPVSGTKSPIKQTSVRKSSGTSVPKSGLNYISHLDGIEKMIHSPSIRETTFDSTAPLEGVDQLFKTPKSTSMAKVPLKTPQDVSVNLSNVQQLFQTPSPSSAQKRQNRSSKAAALNTGGSTVAFEELSKTPDVFSTTPTVFDQSINLNGVERPTDSIVHTSRNSVLFSPVDDQSSSDTVNVAGIIQMLDTSILTPVEGKSPEATTDKPGATLVMEEVEQPDIPEQTEHNTLSKCIRPTPTAIPAKMVNVSVTVNTEVETPTQQRLRRKLYTKNDPDDKTPERIKSSIVRPVTSNEYLHIMNPSVSNKDENSEEKRNRLGKKLTKPAEELTDTESDSSEYESVEVVEPIRKILPSRASRRNIKTLSEEALAGASPELKFVKPKPPKVVEEPSPVIVAETLPTINEDSDINIEGLSAGRRKVMFNENIQIKEINSPAIVGDIIQKVSRGRGGKHQKVVQVIVEQHAIKPARRDNKYERIDDTSIKGEDEIDTSKRTRRGTKRVNYAEEINVNAKTDATTKRSRRGAKKIDNAEKTVNESDTSVTIDVETTKRHKRGAKKHDAGSSEHAVEVEIVSSESNEQTSEKDHAEQPGNTEPDVKEADVIKENNVNAPEPQASAADAASSVSEEVKEDKEKESKTKRSRRPTAKSKSEPKKPSSRAKSKKAEIVPEVEEREKEATSNTQIVLLGGSEDDTVKANEEQQPHLLDTIKVGVSDVKTDKLDKSIDEKAAIATEDNVEEPVEKRSRKPAKKTKSEPKKASSRVNSKKVDTQEKQEASQHETPTIPEVSKQTELPSNLESSHPAEDTTDVDEKPAVKRSRRAPQKVTKATPSASTNVEVQSSSGDTELHEENDTETVSGRGKRGAKKTTSRSAKSHVVTVASDSTEGGNKAIVQTTEKQRQRRLAATTMESVDDSISKTEVLTSAELINSSSKTLHIVEAQVVEQAVADSTSQDEPQPPPAKRGRITRKPSSKAKTPKEEQSVPQDNEVASMPPPAMIVTAEPDESASKQSVRRGRKKPVAEESHPELHHTIEESLNESRMVKTMLPSSHTSTPLMRIEEEKSKPTRGGRTRKLNPVVTALIEAEVTTTPNRSSPRNLRAGSQSRTDDRQTAPAALKTKASRTRTAPKMKPVDDSHDQPTPTTIADEELPEGGNTADKAPSKARKNPPSKRLRGKVEESGSEEHQEVAIKRARKVPAKYRDAQAEDIKEASKNSGESSRNRRGTKSVEQVGEPTTTTTEAGETNDESETVQTKPSRSRKVPAKIRDTHPDSVSKLEDTQEASKENAEPARSRRGAKSSKKTKESTPNETTGTNDDSENVETKPSRSRKMVETKRPTAAASRKEDIDVVATDKGDEASAVKQAHENEEPVETTSSRRRPLRTRK